MKQADCDWLKLTDLVECFLWDPAHVHIIVIGGSHLDFSCWPPPLYTHTHTHTGVSQTLIFCMKTQSADDDDDDERLTLRDSSS